MRGFGASSGDRVGRDHSTTTRRSTGRARTCFTATTASPSRVKVILPVTVIRRLGRVLDPAKRPCSDGRASSATSPRAHQTTPTCSCCTSIGGHEHRRPDCSEHHHRDPHRRLPRPLWGALQTKQVLGRRDRDGRRQGWAAPAGHSPLLPVQRPDPGRHRPGRSREVQATDLGPRFWSVQRAAARAGPASRKPDAARRMVPAPRPSSRHGSPVIPRGHLLSGRSTRPRPDGSPYRQDTRSPLARAGYLPPSGRRGPGSRRRGRARARGRASA